MSEVKVGQIWSDNDSRFFGSMGGVILKKVVSIEGEFAIVENTITNRRTKIRLNRFKPTSNGYKLVKEAPNAKES